MIKSSDNSVTRSGKMNQMIRAIKVVIDGGKGVAVIGCKDPEYITDRLKELGTDCRSEPLYSTGPIKMTYNSVGYEQEIIGFENGEKRLNGFAFHPIV